MTSVKHGMTDTISVYVLGRRDAWKRLQGMDGMEAKHRYVEVLLKVAIEVHIQQTMRLHNIRKSKHNSLIMSIRI